MNAGYVIGAGVVMRKLCKRRDANLDPTSLVFPTIGISLFKPISQNPIFFRGFFFGHVAWVGYVL